MQSLSRAFLALLALFVVLNRVALAHPLGQLNADSKAEYHLDPQHLEVVYRVTFATGATLTRLPQLDKNGDGVIDATEESEYLKLNSQHFKENLHLKLDQRELKLELGQCRLSTDKDVNGLPQLALEIRLHTPWAVGAQEQTLVIDDKSFEGVGGWREIQASAEGGLGIVTAPNPPKDAVEALQTRGEIKFHQGPTTWKPSAATANRKNGNGDQSLLKRIADPQGGLQTILLTLGLAYVLGALHALQPGHGKTVVGAYLIGSRGTVWHAVLLGLVVTFTHTFSVILLGVAALFAFNTVVPEKLIPWLGCLSGLLVSVMGVILILYRDTLFGHTHSHGHGHSHDHSHSHSRSHAAEQAPRPYAGTVPIEQAGTRQRLGEPVEDSIEMAATDPPIASQEGGLTESLEGHSHSHMIPEKLTLAGLISLGVSGGMVPCPDALVVLLGAISLKKLALGLLVLLAFSAGLASVLMAVGILMVKASHLFAKRYPSPVTVRRITELSYLFIVIMGLFLAFQSLWSGGIIGPPRSV